MKGKTLESLKQSPEETQHLPAEVKHLILFFYGCLKQVFPCESFQKSFHICERCFDRSIPDWLDEKRMELQFLVQTADKD